MIESRAAVAHGAGEPLKVETVMFDDPGDGEVVVRVRAAALCHSDLHVINGALPAVPMIMGHEAGGIVEAVGPGVSGLKLGDHVIFSFIPACGHCHFCQRGKTVMCERGPAPAGLPLSGRYQARLADGAEIGQMQRLGAFSERTVVHEDSCTMVPADMNLAAASLLSCGFTTGAGAVLSAAATQPGDSVVVIGAGGVGHAAVMGAVIAGASTIIAVDVQASKLDSARRFGATATVNASETDWVAAVRELTGGYGADRAISSLTQSTGEHLQQLIAAVSRGGTAVMVGSVTGLASIDVPPRGLVWEAKTLVGTLYGTHDPRREQVRFIDLYRAGRLPLDDLITATYGLDEINVALADLSAGKNIRGVIEM